MISLILIAIILSSLIQCEHTWKLQWNDEFNQDQLNAHTKMWDIEDTGNRCQGNFNY